MNTATKDQAGCNRCGRCCYYPFGEKPGPGEKDTRKMKKCRYLVWTSKDTTLCRIYNDPSRIGRILDKQPDGELVRCNHVSDVPFTWKGCPFNHGRTYMKVFKGD